MIGPPSVSRVRPPGGGLIADPVARPWTEAARSVVRVREPAAVQGQAPAADALGESRPQALELGDALVNPRSPRGREPRPVAACGRTIGGEPAELGADLIEREADSLREDDEGNAAQYGAGEAPVTRARTFRGDQTALLVEAKRGGRDPAAPRELADRQGVHIPT